MASIFTYDPDPPRVASPWITPANTPKPSTPQPLAHASPQLLADYSMTKLEAEPQDGSTEYKLHLLLRPRRKYRSSSTATTATSKEELQGFGSASHVVNDSNILPAYPKPRRQNRLEQLTTQLLWRLQQSSPNHTSSANNLVLPRLPEATASLETPVRPNKLVVGLEESRGALYEIGVSDDGTFVGLTKDEMEESLTNLRAMAASLGCTVGVKRMVAVGDCEWLESGDTLYDTEPLHLSIPQNQSSNPESIAKKVVHDHTGDHGEHGSGVEKTKYVKGILRHQDHLFVAEALVIPDLRSRTSTIPRAPDTHDTGRLHEIQLPAVQSVSSPKTVSQNTEQLRITLTGPTTSGKSSLLGTLSTATLDNGRGKSRLSLLKHRHEIATGITSSVAQELIGYRALKVVNYASGNVTSWTDIHASAEKGRLVFVSDSAGHPRYRRTTVRGLVGWTPHWTLLCVAADDGENAPSSAGGTSSAQEILGTAGAGIDLAKAHLELCLKLDKPLAIIITKLDLASKASLRQTLSKILTAIKTAGRTPAILPPDRVKTVTESDLGSILESDITSMEGVIQMLRESDNLASAVPIIMTSSAKGTGIRLMHTLLATLPIPRAPTAHDFTGLALNPEQPACLFHIEDVFGMPASYEPLISDSSKQSESGTVVAGHLRFGRLSVGDAIVVGPFPSEAEDYSPPNKQGARSSPNSFGASLSHPSTSEPARISSRNVASVSVAKGEWHNAHIVSLRNLRLPVHTLEAGQVGTVGIQFDIPVEELSGGPFEREFPRPPLIRKGMVMAIPSLHMIKTGHTLQAASGFTASFEDGDINSVTPGSLVVVYIASIRASARVLRLTPHAVSIDHGKTEDEDDVFGLDALDNEEQQADPPVFGSDGITDVTLELITSRWWVELGSQVLVMPGGGHGLYYGSERGEKGVAGLEGFVGKVIEVVD